MLRLPEYKFSIFFALFRGAVFEVLTKRFLTKPNNFARFRINDALKVGIGISINISDLIDEFFPGRTPLTPNLQVAPNFPRTFDSGAFGLHLKEIRRCHDFPKHQMDMPCIVATSLTRQTLLSHTIRHARLTASSTFPRLTVLHIHLSSRDDDDSNEDDAVAYHSRCAWRLAFSAYSRRLKRIRSTKSKPV
ncbi:hypothetical protein [Burkholderia gladioli]|uniref:hypothetical protein n=1 Tax=Burkholderia gladioli TaxID=28095 RepID=UPI00163F3FD4|nr:hypothetical protein [Burkholderia gladioli]